MDKQIFIINGSGGVGKDTFVSYVTIELNDKVKRFDTVINFSSIDKIKEIAREIGWNGSKTEKNREFLSDLKALAGNYNDMPFQSLRDKVDDFKTEDNKSILLFLHIREPEEIDRAVKEFNAKTILVKRESVEHIVSNASDKNVYNFIYDYVIENNGDKKELYETVKSFLKEVVFNE